MQRSERGYPRLIGFERVVNHFGYWPTFHDAEVLSLTLDRDAQVGKTGPTLTIAVHAFEISKEVTAAGYLKTAKHCVVTFAFYDVYLEKLEDFSNQNAIMGLNLTDITADGLEHLRLAAAIEGSNGLTCSFQCRYGQLLDLTPGIPPNSMYRDKETV
jgi:hypothetical protein